MKSIEIAVINPKDERQALLAWAARVDADIQILSAVGLIEKRNAGLFAPYDEINIHKTLRKAA